MTIPRRLMVLLFACAAISAARAADAATNWGEKCAKCHGEDGKGNTKMGRKLSISDMTDPKVQATFTDDEGLAAIKQGLTDNKGKTTMKAIEGLSDDEMKALVAHVRSLVKK